MVRRLCILALMCTIAGGLGCGPSVDLSKALKVTEVFGGWYDDGVKNGTNHMVPSISFRLQNAGTAALDEVDLLVSFWMEGADGEWDSRDVQAIGSTAVQPGASTQPILVRADVGYNLQQARAELFTNTGFKDVIAKLVAKRGGRFYPLGEFKLDRRIIPNAAETVGRQ